MKAETRILAGSTLASLCVSMAALRSDARSVTFLLMALGWYLYACWTAAGLLRQMWREHKAKQP